MAASRPGPPLWLSVPLLIAGVVIAVVSAAFFTIAILRSETDALSFATPGSEQVALPSGRFDIFTSNTTAALTPSTVSVYPVGGSPVVLGPMSARLSFRKDGANYQGVLSFQAARPGEYRVDVSIGAGDVAVVPDLMTETAWNRGWLIGFFAGAVLGIAGLVLLIVGLVRRSRANRALRAAANAYGGWPPPAQPPHPPPGAYPRPWPPPPDESQRWVHPGVNGSGNGNGVVKGNGVGGGAAGNGKTDYDSGTVPDAPSPDRPSGWPQSSEKPDSQEPPQPPQQQPPSGGLGP